MRKKKKASPNLPVATLQSEAAKLLNAGRYKEAIEAYKRLLKNEQRQTWQTALAKAYLLRAQNLAAKGMYREATVLWENRANLTPDDQLIDKYLSWLIHAGRHVRAARIFLDSTALSADQQWQLQSQFGPLILTGHHDLIEVFSPETAFIQQYTIVQKALEAYYQSDDTTATKYISQISFRSPFRDLRPIIKALLVIETDPNEAEQLLNKVPTDSPYTNFAQLLHMATEQNDTSIERLSKLSTPQQNLLANLKGWDKSQFKLMTMMQTAAKRDTNKALLEVVTTNRQALGTEYSQQFCLALLPSYPKGTKLYERTYVPLSEFAHNRIAALGYERQGDSIKADRQWRLCINALQQKTEDTALKSALILRHLAVLADQRGDIFDDNSVPRDLAKSLQFDPDDKTTYSSLIKWYDHTDNQKSYQKWVEVAVKQLPEDSEILLIAMEAATRKKAFKKAVGFAKTLLKVDPINVKARQVARFSHISHARKLIRTEKYTLARKELTQAANLEKVKQRSGVVQINQGLLELQAQGFIKPILKSRSKTNKKTSPVSKRPKAKIQDSSAIELIHEGVQLCGGGISGQLRVIVETKSQNLDTANVLPLLLPLKKQYRLTQREVLELISLLNAYSEEGITFLTEVVEQLKMHLQKAVEIDFSQDEMLSLCECLKKIKHYELLSQFTDQALQRWPKHPAFVFYQVCGKAKGSKDMWSIHPSDMERLEDAVARAEKQGDKRTSIMILSFLNQMQGGFLRPPAHPFDDMFDDDDIEEELEELRDKLEALERRRGDLKNASPEEIMEILSHLEELGIELPDFDKPIPRMRKKKRKKR